MQRVQDPSGDMELDDDLKPGSHRDAKHVAPDESRLPGVGVLLEIGDTPENCLMFVPLGFFFKPVCGMLLSLKIPTQQGSFFVQLG